MLSKNKQMLRKLSTSKSLYIELLEPIVYIGSNLNVPPVIRGTVIIAVSKPCKIRSLMVQFKGSLKTKWIQENKIYNTKKSIAFNELLLHSTKNDELELNVGTTRFAFEMPLPAGIPESVHCSQISVDYHLTVNMQYKKQTSIGLSNHKESIQKDVIVARLPDFGIFTSGESYPVIDSHKHFSRWFQYRITVDKKSLALGSHLPIKIEIAPVVQGLKLKQIIVQLLESRTIFPDNETKTTSQLCHFISPAKGQKFKLLKSPLSSTWEDTCEYLIPDNGSIAHSTEKTYPGFYVGHTLLISFVIAVPNQGTRNFSFQTEVDLLDSRVSDINSSDNQLPAYNFPVSKDEIRRLSLYDLTTPPPYESLTAI